MAYDTTSLFMLRYSELLSRETSNGTRQSIPAAERAFSLLFFSFSSTELATTTPQNIIALQDGREALK